MFTSNGALAIRTILNFGDSIFSITVPGTTISFKTLFLSVLITCFVISMIKYFLNSSGLVVSGAEKVINRKDD